MAVETPGAPAPTGIADPVSDLNSILQNPAVAPRQKEIQDTFAQQKLDRDQLQTYIQSLPLDADSKTRMWKSYWSYPSAPAPKPAPAVAPPPQPSLLSRATDYASKKISGAESAIVGGVASGLPMPTPPALPVPPVPSGVKMSVQSPVASVGSVDQKPPLSLGRPRTLMAGVPTVPPVLPKSDYAGVSPKVAGIHETKDGYNVVMDDGTETTLPLHDVPFFKEYPRLTNADVYGLRNPGLKGPTAPVSPDQKFQAIDPKLDENGKFRPAAIWEQQPPKPDTSWWDVLKEAPGAISQVGKESRKKTTWESFRDTYATVVNGAARVLSDVTLGHYDADKGTLTFPQSMLSMPGMPGHPTPLGKLVPSGTVQLRDMSVSDILEHYLGVPADLAHDGTAAQIGSLIGIAKPWGEISKVLEAGTALTEANALAKIGEEGLLDGRAAAKAADITKRMLRNAGLQAASGEIVGHLEAAPPNETAAERELRAGKNALYGAGFSVLLDSVAHLWAALPKGAKGSTTAAVREPFDKVVNDIYDLFYKSGTFSSEEAAQAAADKTIMSSFEQAGIKKQTLDEWFIERQNNPNGLPTIRTKPTIEELRDSVKRRFEANKAAGESVVPETPAPAPAESRAPVTTPVQTGPTTMETAGIPTPIAGPEKPPSTELPAPPEIPSETSRIPRPKKQFTHNGQDVRGISGDQVVLADGSTAERAPSYIETLRKYGYSDLTPEQIQGLKGQEAPAVDPTKDLPSDVTYLGPQEVPSGKPMHLYNLELPDGTLATFAVREGQDVTAKADETRKKFQEGGNGSAESYTAKLRDLEKQLETAQALERDPAQSSDIRGEASLQVDELLDEINMFQQKAGIPKELRAQSGPRTYDPTGIEKPPTVDFIPKSDAHDATNLGPRWHTNEDLGSVEEDAPKYWMDGATPEDGSAAISQERPDGPYAVATKDGVNLGPFDSLQEAVAAAEKAVPQKNVTPGAGTPKALPEVPGAKTAEKTVSYTDNSVRDHPQSVQITGDTITVRHKVGRKTASMTTIPLSEWLAAQKGPSANPAWNERKLIEKYTEPLGMDEQPGGPNQADRIRDAAGYAIKGALKKQGEGSVSQPPALPAPPEPTEIPEPATGEAAEEGASPEETKEIAEEFIQRQGDRDVTRIFDAPKKGEIVRLKDKVDAYQAKSGWMTIEEAKQQIEQWKAHAAAQGETGANSNKIVLSLFDRTGEWAKPWLDAGYQVHTFDIQNDPEFGDVKNFSAEFFMDLFGDFEGQDIHAVIAACPCTDFAVSGARHFAAKDADGRTVDSVALVRQTLATIEYFKPVIWAIENPVGRIEKLSGLPPWRMSFDPNAFGDPYTKKTLLWGRFNGDLPIAPVEPVEGSKMHSQYGGKSQATKNARSVTPEGFAYSFFMANNAVDHPEMTAANKYDRLDKGLIDRAIAAGLTLEDIDHAVDDDYYMDLNDRAAEKHLQEAIDAKKSGAASSLPPVPPVPSTKSGKARAPKSYAEAQKQIDRFEDRIEEKYGKSALKDLMLAETNASLGFTKESHPNIPHPSIDFTPGELAESKRLYEQRDALDQADVETNVKEIDQKFKPLIPDAAARQKLVRELAQADIPTALRSEYQTGEKWRDIGKAVNIIVQYISKHVTHDVEQTAFHVSSVLDPNWDPKTGTTPVPTRIRIESERGLGPSQATLDEAQRWMDHLYPDDPPKIPGAKSQTKLPEVPATAVTSEGGLPDVPSPGITESQGGAIHGGRPTEAGGETAAVGAAEPSTGPTGGTGEPGGETVRGEGTRPGRDSRTGGRGADAIARGGVDNSGFYRITDADELGSGGAVTKFKDNLKAIASGNPDVKRKIELEQQINKWGSLEASHIQDDRTRESKIQSKQRDIVAIHTQMAHYQKTKDEFDAYLAAHPKSGDEEPFSVVLGGREISDRKEFVDYVENNKAEVFQTGNTATIYGVPITFETVVSPNSNYGIVGVSKGKKQAYRVEDKEASKLVSDAFDTSDEARAFITQKFGTETNYRYSVTNHWEDVPETIPGFLQGLRSRLVRVAASLKQDAERLTESERQIASIRNEMGHPFKYASELAEARQELSEVNLRLQPPKEQAKDDALLDVEDDPDSKPTDSGATDNPVSPDSQAGRMGDVPPPIARPGSRNPLSTRSSLLPVSKPPLTLNGKTYDPTFVKVAKKSGRNRVHENVAGWEIAPGLAVTDGENGTYRVTHAQSGLAIGNVFDSPEQAVAYGERLAKATDWTRSQEDLSSDLDLRTKMRQIAGERGSIPLFSKKAPDPIPDDQLKFSTKESNDVVALEPQDRKNLWERVNGFAKYAQKFHNAVVYNGDIEMWPVFAEQVRRAQELAADAAGQTQTKMQEILKGLSPNEENVARRIVYFEDMYETATRLGEDRIPLELNSQFANKLDQMDHDLVHLHDIATPAVEQSVERFHDWMNEVRDNLVSRGKMSADHGYERYFPNQFLHSSGNERLPGMPTRLQEPWRGYTQARKGHVIPHDPDWIRVMEKYGTRFYLDNAIDDFIRSTSESHDFKQWLSSDQTKKLMAESHGELKADHVYSVDLADLTPQQVRTISTGVFGGSNYTGKLPASIKLTGFQFNPNPVFYPAQAIVEQVITDAMNAGLEELGIDLNKLRDTAAAQGRAPGELPRPPELQTVMEEPLTKGVLALGSEHKMYLLPVEVAQRLKNFRQAGIVGPFTEFARAATQAWKASVIHFSGGAYYTHVTLGNEITLFAEDTMALAKQPQALAMLRKKLTPPQYAQMIRLFEDARVWNSVFYTGSTRPATTTIPDIRKYRPAQGLSRLNPFGENVLGDALREWQRYGQIVQVVPKLAKFLADMERVEQGQPIVNSAVNMHGLDPTSVLAAGKNARENVHPDYRGVAPGMRGFYTAFPFAAYHMKIVAPWLRRASAKGWAFPGDKFLALIGGLYVSAWIWNHFMYPEDEHELPPWQKEMLHINTGLRDASGKILSVGMEIPTDIIARWGGLHTVSENLDKVREGTWTLEQAAEQQAKDIFGHQKLSLMPTAPAAMLQKLFNPVLMAITEMYANKDSQTGHEIVPKSNRSLWGDPSAAWPQTETGATMMSEHFVKRLISPYMQFLRAAQSDDPDSAFSTWLTDSGPFSWKRALGVRKAVPGAGDSADWYSDSDLQQSLYEEKIKKMSDAYVQWAGGNISAEQRDAMIAPILDQAGPNPTFSAATGESDLQKLQARPQYKIWVAEETLRKTADPQERRDLQDQISALRYQIARDNYKNLPEPVKKVVPVPPVPLPLPPVPNP